VGVLGKHAAMKIGEAYDGGNGDIDYVTHKIAHLALGGAIAAASGDDIAAGAIGGMIGEITAEAFLTDRIQSGMTEEDIDKLEAVGVDFSKLAAGLAAAVAGADVDTAAGTAENAAQNNAVDTFFDALFVLADAGKIAWGWYTDDDGLLQEGIIDLTADSAALLIPCVPAGSTRVARIFQKAASKTDDVVDAAKAIDNAGDAAKVVDNVADAGKIGENVSGGVKHSDKYAHVGKRLDENAARQFDNKTIKTDDALDLAQDFLGSGYKDMGGGRFLSKDGTRQVRMGDADITGQHAGGNHMNFEILTPNPKKLGKMMIKKKDNLHIFLKD